MQVTGTFPELSAGRSKGTPKKPAMKAPSKRAGGFSGFKIGGKGRKATPQNARSFAGRRAAAHAKGSGQ